MVGLDCPHGDQGVGPLSEGVGDLITALSRDINRSASLQEAELLAPEIEMLARANLHGEDLDGDGRIGSSPDEYGLLQLRRDIESMIAREDPPYATVSSWYLFNLIRLPDGSWIFRNRYANEVDDPYGGGGGGGGGGGPTQPPPPVVPPSGVTFTPDRTPGGNSVFLGAGTGGSATVFVLDVEAQTVTDLYGVSFVLKYPDDLLGFRRGSASEGPFLNGSFRTELIVKQRSPGELTVGISRINEVPGATGSGEGLGWNRSGAKIDSRSLYSQDSRRPSATLQKVTNSPPANRGEAACGIHRDGRTFLLNSVICQLRDDPITREMRLSDLDYGLIQIESYGLLSLRVALAHLDQGWEMALRGDNLTDEAYAINSSGDDGGSFWDMPGRPASWTVELRYDF